MLLLFAGAVPAAQASTGCTAFNTYRTNNFSGTFTLSGGVIQESSAFKWQNGAHTQAASLIRTSAQTNDSGLSTAAWVPDTSTTFVFSANDTITVSGNVSGLSGGQSLKIGLRYSATGGTTGTNDQSNITGNGSYSFTRVLTGTEGEVGIQVNGINASATVTYDVTCTPASGPATQLDFSQQPTSTSSNTAISPAITVRLLDSGGNLSSSTNQVTLAIANNPSGGTLSGTTTVNAVAGVATFSNLSINKAGTGYTLTATSSGLGSDTSSAFNISAGAPSQLAVSAPSSATAGTPVTVNVTAQDSAGNTTTGYSGTVHFTSSDGAAVLQSDTTLTAGVGSFSATFNTVGSQTVTATDTVTSSITGTSGAITVTAGPGVTGISPENGLAGASAPAAVAITGSNFGADAAHNTVTFGGTVGTISSASASSITVTPPANSTAGQVNVVVTNTTSGLSTTVTNGYRYVSPPQITTASTNPTSFTNGDANGATVTYTIQNPNGVALSGVQLAISGSTFNLSNPGTTCSGGTAGISGGNVTLTSLAANATCNLSFKVLPSAASYYGATTVSGQISAGGVGADSFTMTGNTIGAGSLTVRQAIPTVSQVSPSTGVVTGATAVTITGTNFDTVPSTGAVKFGAVTATYTVTSATTISAQAPAAGSTGTVHVTVTNEGGTSTTSSSDQYTYINAPTVAISTPANGSTTGADTITVTGTAANATSVTVTFQGTNYGPITITGGNWSQALPGPLADGTYTVTAVSTNGTDTSTTASSTFTIAKPTVAITAPANGGTVSSSSVTVTGTATNATSVSLTVNGTNYGPITVTGGNWSQALTAPVANGVYNVSAVSTDGTNNSTTATSSFTVAAPTVAITSPSNGGTVSSNAVTVTGTAANATSVTLTVNGTNYGPIAVTGGNWSQALAGPVANGVYNLSAVSTDGSNNSGTATSSFTVAAPTVAITAPSNGATLTSGTVTVSGTAANATSVTITFQGNSYGPITVTGGNWSQALPGPLANGNYSVSAVSTDGSTNGTTASSSFTVAIPAPGITSATPAFGSTAGGTSVTIQGSNFDTALSGNTVTIGGSAATVTAATASSLTVTTGVHAAGQVDVVVQNSGGTATLTNGFEYIAPPGVPTINSTPAALSNSNSASFGFTLSGGTGECALDSGAFVACTSPQAYTGLAQGAHSFQVRATNSVGTSAAASYNWNVDTVAPNPPVVTVPANNAFLPAGTATVTGTAEANSTVSIYIDGALDKTVSAGSGSWTTSTTTSLSAGTHSIKAQATDAAGNVSTDSNVQSVTVGSAPSATTAQANVSGTVGAALNVTPVTGSGGSGTLTYSISPALPGSLSINGTTGAITGTPSATLASTSYTVTVTDQATQTASATFQLTVNPTPTPVLSFATPGAASVVLGGSLTNAATSSIPGGGAISYSSDTPGVATVNPSTGAITTVGAGTATITATQAASAGVNTVATQTYTLTVHPQLSTTQAVASATLAQDVAATSFTPVTASGGVGTLSYAVSPTLPAGLSISGTTGAISGTPTTALTATTFTVTVTDQTPGTPQSSSKTFQLSVTGTPTPVLSFATPTAASVVLGGSLTNAATSTIPGGGAISYSSGTPGVATVDPATGAITTVSAGTAVITATQAASAGVNTTATQSYTLTVHPQLTTSQSMASVTMTVNVATPSVTPVTATGGVGTLSYAVSPGLPAGLSINGATGAITGTPTTTLATTTFTVTVTDQTPGGPQSSSKTFQLSIAAEPTPVLTFATPTAASVVMGGSLTNTATSSVAGGGAITYSSGTPGVATVNAATGAITTVSPGTTIITATQAASPGVNSQATQTYTLTVHPLLTTSQAVPSTTLIRTQPAAPFTPVTAAGGVGTLQYAVSPSLPAGLTLNTSNGTISGTPTEALAVTSFTVTVTDQTPGGPQTSSKTFQLAVTGAPTVAEKTGVAVPYASTGTAIDLSSSITGAAHTSIAIGTAPAHGTVAISGDVVTYTPAATYFGADSFTYTATGPGGTSAPATVSLTVATPAAPTVADKTGVAVPYASTGTAIDLSASITGVRSSIAVVTAPAHGTVTIAGEVVTYTPAATYFGADSFTYTATGPGGTSAPATVSLTVATPAAPTVADKTGVAVPYASTGTAIDLSASITGVRSSIAVVTAPAHGTATIAGEVVTYKPADGYFGADSFTYTATGPGGTSAPATVSLTVATPAAPTAANKTGVAVAYNSPGTAIDLAPSITGVHTVLTVTTAPGHGTATVNGDVVTYVPASGYFGADSFAYTVTGPGGTSPAATVSLTVATPPPPAAAPGTGTVAGSTTTAGTSVNIDLSALVTGVYDTIEIQTPPQHGTVTLSGGGTRQSGKGEAAPATPIVATYTPTPNYAGTDSFTFVAVGPGGRSAPGTVTINVVGQVPVATPKVATTGDGQTVSVMLTDGAIRGPFTGAAVVSVSPANAATTAIVASGAGTSAAYRLDVTPNNRFGGTIVVTYTLTNVYGTSAPSTVTLTVQARPDPRNDPNVGAISDAQAEAARRFARAQVSNFMRRTEQLHNGGGSAGMAMGVSLASRDGQTPMQRPDDRNWDQAVTERMHVSGEDPALGRIANDPNSPLSRNARLGYDRSVMTSGSAVVAGSRPASAPGKPAQPDQGDGTRRIGTVATWAGGAIDIGTRDKTTDRTKVTATTAGLSAGADIKLAEGVVVGLGGGYGNDLSRIGTAAQVRGTSTLYAAYASIEPAEGAFVDGVVGHGKLDFTTRRIAAAVNATARGSRDGSYTVAAISLGIDRTDGPLQWSLYGRGEYMNAELGAYSESGAGRYNLRFSERDVRSVTGTLGARFQYRQKVDFGAITPRIRAEWNHEFADVDAQWLDYADIPGAAAYALSGSGWKREQLQLSIGTRFDILRGGWSFDFETGLRTGQGEKAGTLQLRLSKQF